MARVAPHEGGDRNITGTRSGFRTVLRNGDVLRVEDHFVVLWRPTENGWIGFPVVPQTGPLHRSNVVLASGEVSMLSVRGAPRGRLIVLTARPELVPHNAAMVVGSLAGIVADRIGQTLRRALASSLSEGGHVAL